METTRLSSKGQVIISKIFRAAHRWEPGQELVVIHVEDGVLLKSKTPFAETTLDEIASSLRVTGKTRVSIDLFLNNVHKLLNNIVILRLHRPATNKIT